MSKLKSEVNMKFEKLKRVVIKEEYVALTGNIISALILNQFQYWSERVKDFDLFIKEEKKRFEAEGKEIKMELQNGWIYKKYDELKDELMLTDSAKTVGRYLAKLVEAGFLDRRRNPSIKYDRTYQYRINLAKIAIELGKIGYSLQDYKVDFSDEIDEIRKRQIDPLKVQKENLNGQIDPTKVENVQTIPEITTKNTTESITKASAKNDAACSNTLANSFNSEDMKNIIKSIEIIYSNTTGNNVNVNDKNSIKEVLTGTTDYKISLDEKFKIIKDTVYRVADDFSKRNPFSKINSFKYFQKSIFEEFRKYNRDTPQDENISNEVEEFFEKAWSMYPRKEGKNDIPTLQKIKIYKLGDDFINCIQRYLKYDKDLIINGNWKELQSGKKFFTSGYLDWTNEEFENKKANFKSAAEIRKERIFKLLEDQKEAGIL
jgi:predicted transcriptional regulator